MAHSAQALAHSAARRVQAGDLAVQEAARTEIEAQRAAADEQAAQLELQRARLALAAVLGYAPGTALRASEADWPTADTPTPAPPDWAQAALSRSDVLAAQQRLAAAQAAQDSALATRQADPTWGASLDHYPGSSTRQLELRLQLPLQGLLGGYDQQGEIARAQALRSQAQDSLERTQQLAQLELRGLHQSLVSAGARAQRYAREILPRARRMAEGAELAYQKGALPLGDLLDARRTLRATLIEALAARIEHAKALLAWQLRTPASSASSASSASAASQP